MEPLQQDYRELQAKLGYIEAVYKISFCVILSTDPPSLTFIMVEFGKILAIPSSGDSPRRDDEKAKALKHALFRFKVFCVV